MMNKSRRKHNFIYCAAAVFLAALLCLAPVSSASAASAIDPDHAASLSLTYVNDGTALAKTPVHLYRVASVSAYDDYTLAGDFTGSSVDLSNIQTNTAWNAAASTLAIYAAVNEISALSDRKTDADGNVSFGTLQTGLYLVITDTAVIDGNTYTVDPFLISLPNLDTNDSWVYDVASAPKSVKKAPPVGNVVVYKVVKHWDDTGYESMRPDTITVDLLKDGNVVMTEVLNSDNDWSFSWETENDGSTWQASERDVPELYTVTSTTDGTTLILTNTYSPTETPPGSSTVFHNTTTSGPKTGDSTQTGTIVFMASAGLVFLVMGWRRRLEEQES